MQLLIFIFVIVTNFTILIYLFYKFFFNKTGQKLKNHNFLLYKTLDELNDIVILLNEKKEMIFLNKNLQTILNYDTEDFINKNYEEFLKIVSDEDRLKINRLIKNEDNDLIANIQIISKDQINRNFSVKFVVITDLFISFKYIVFLKDVTDYYLLKIMAKEKEVSLLSANEQFKLANEELKHQKEQYQDLNNKLKVLNENLVSRTKELLKANEELASLDEMKNNILSTISHELRTPLVSIRGYSEWILSGRVGPITEAMEKGLKISIKNVDKLVSLIDELLTLSSPFEKKRDIHIQEINIIDVIKEAVDMEMPNIEAKKIKLIFDYPEDKDIFMLGDKSKITQVMLNLITNAIKFNQVSGQIIITVELINTNEVSISVTDTGIGISQEHFNKIFHKFYQIDSKLTKKFSGLGIGLSIVKDIIEYHKGTISLTSELGKKTTFYIHFPVIKIVGHTPFINPNNNISSIDIPTILIIEDEIDIADYMKLLIEDEGYKAVIITKPDKSQIFQAFKNNISLILLDIVMPEMNGFKVCEEIKKTEKTKDIPIIVVTGKADIIANDKLNKFGIKDYIKKPFNIEEFLQTIKKYI